jgi:DNA-binding protein YbaB
VQVGVKVQALQAELAQTEVECATNDGGVRANRHERVSVACPFASGGHVLSATPAICRQVVVKVSGTQVPMSVTVSEALCERGVEAVSAELTTALKAAHTKSGLYAQDRMRAMVRRPGSNPGMAARCADTRASPSPQYEEMGLSAGMAGMGGKPGA